MSVTAPRFTYMRVWRNGDACGLGPHFLTDIAGSNPVTRTNWNRVSSHTGINRNWQRDGLLTHKISFFWRFESSYQCEHVHHTCSRIKMVMDEASACKCPLHGRSRGVGTLFVYAGASENARVIKLAVHGPSSRQIRTGFTFLGFLRFGGIAELVYAVGSEPASK